MMFYMTSKVFQDDFLTNEKDDDILKAQYVIVSTRIRSKREKGLDNILNAKASLFPDAWVCGATSSEEMRERYFSLCSTESNLALLATLIIGSIKEGYNLIFLCTHNERKLHYLEYLSDFVYIKFGYPVYEYRSFIKTGDAIQYDKKKVLNKCNKYVEKAKKKRRKMLVTKGENGIKKVMEDYSKMGKKDLKKILQKQNLYTEGMSKSDMLDTIEVFIT